MYQPYNNNVPYGYQPQPQPPNQLRNQNFINTPPGKYIPPVNPNYNNNNIQPGGNLYQNNGGIYNNNPPVGNKFPNNPNNYGNNGYNNYNNQQGGNLYPGNGNFYGNNNNYNNQPQQYPGQNNASFPKETNNGGEVEFGFSSSIYGTQTNQPKSNGANNIYGSNNTDQNPPPIYQAQQQKNIPGYNQPQKYQNNQFPPNGQINGNTQQKQQMFNYQNQNSSQNNIIYPGQQMPGQQNLNNIQQPGNNIIYNFNNTDNMQSNFTKLMIQQQKPKIENALIANQQNLNIQQNSPQIPQGNNFNNSFQGISPPAPFNPNQPKINYNNNIQTNQIINQPQNILNNNIQSKQGPELNKINNQFSGMNISGQNINNVNNFNNNNFNNNPNNFSNNYNNNNILNNNNLNNFNNFNNNNSANMNNNIINNNNFNNNNSANMNNNIINNNNFNNNNSANINANSDPSKLLNNNNGVNKNQNNFNGLNDKIDKIFDTKTVVETQINNTDNSNKINQDVIKKQGQHSSPYPNAIEFSNNGPQKRENNNFADKTGNQTNIINLFNLPETSTIKHDSISKPNIQQNNNINQNEWKDVILDPLAQVCVVQTKIEDKKNNNNNKENESNVDDEEKASKSINPFYQENPFENNLEGSNNKWRVPDNNDLKPKENEVNQPDQIINPQFNLNFSSIKEVSTIINEKPKEQNNIDNLNTEQNKKEWGNINLDPFAEANIVATKVENKKKGETLI